MARALPGIVLVLTLLPFLTACDFLEAMLAPKAELWERWQANDPAAAAVIDHAPWANFLERYLSRGRDGVNRIAYASVTAEEREKLRGYISAISKLPISEYRRAEQQAFWVNLYNALTVQLVLEHFPVESITDIPHGLFAFGPWDKPLTEVEGLPLTLGDIEHRILRPIWGDPRIHYVVNCASIGCPNLPSTPLSAANMEARLDAAAREYINHPRGARVENGKLVASKLYNWFSQDFGGGGSPEDVLAHLKRFAEPALARALEPLRKIHTFQYDWKLNAAGRAAE